MRYHILINANSGTSLKLGREKIETAIRTGLDVESFDFLSGDAFFDRMRELLVSPFPTLIGGGDGSIARAAEIHMEKNKPFGVLPFGTMNLLAQDLNVPVNFYDSIAAYKNTQTVSIDVGLANGHVFLCCVAFGSMPEAAKLREENRHISNVVMLPRLTAYVYNRLDFTRKRYIRLTLDHRFKKLKTGMLVISNNAYNPAAAASFRKDNMQTGLLGVYTVTPKTRWDKLRLALAMRSGAWKSDPSVTEDQAVTVVLNTNRKTELISVDGEPVEMKMPLRCTLMQQSLDVIVPVPEVASGPAEQAA